MDVQDRGPPGLLDRAIEYAAQNLRIEKLLIQLGLPDEHGQRGVVGGDGGDLSVDLVHGEGQVERQ